MSPLFLLSRLNCAQRFAKPRARLCAKSRDLPRNPRCAQPLRATFGNELQVARVVVRSPDRATLVARPKIESRGSPRPGCARKVEICRENRVARHVGAQLLEMKSGLRAAKPTRRPKVSSSVNAEEASGRKS